MSDPEPAVSEFWEVDDFGFGMVGVYLLSGFVVVAGFAIDIGRPHIDEPGVFAGTGSICG
jgi:hypothetical protein